MKKAEEYIINGICYREDIEAYIKQAQIDAIDEAIKMCAEKATVIHIDLESNETFDYTDVLIDDNVDIRVDKQSILQVAEQLKKELV